MDPMFGSNINTGPIMAPMSSYMFAPGIFFTNDERDDYLSKLDSDTRDYVMKHTDSFRTRQDIEDCINSLHSNRKRKE
ncbi:hypothetical protein I5677_14795 [Mobilitalea sibirica]|uniref:Uncharacterized protein n=1 Tax=Mobilitalea sibirica TaxID=1462919 RepID=A0A8J7L0E4_9FIRM|nr:hypothetical protein [Mobilitalea sibirica]MBH1942168.1 hypothetical protein [Mobilitalea sibirica]